MASTQNSGRKLPSKGRPFPKGKSGNPGGRPKNRTSITYWLNEFGNMTPVAVAEICEAWAKDLRGVKGDLPMFALVAVKALWTIIQEGAPSLLAQVLERTEGRVAQTMNLNWKEELEKHGLNASDAFERLVQLALDQLAQADARADGSRSPAGGTAAPKPRPEAVAGTGETGTAAS